MSSRLRHAWRFLGGSSPTRRELLSRRWAGDLIALLWSTYLLLQAAAVWLPAAAGTRDLIVEWFRRLPTWQTALVLGGVEAFGFAYVWFWGWMGLDAYRRRFGDSDVLSAQRLLWLLALCAGWLTAPVYWLVVKRKDVNTELEALRETLDAAQ